MPVSIARGRAPTIAASLQEYGRGLAGGLMFSLPLLYTMEMWWAGFIAAPLRLAGMLAFTYVLLLGYNRFAGMHRDATWPEVAIDSVEELGLGLVTSAGILYLLQQIGPGTPPAETLGKIVVEASVVAIGFSVGTAQLNAGGDDEEGEADRKARDSGFAADLVIATCGAVLFASNVAPTEEILMIAIEADPFRLIGLAVLSLAIGSTVLYFTNFRRSNVFVRREGPLDVVLGTIVTYAIAIVTAAIILWFFGRFDGVAREIAVRQAVVLAFPATLGASAGRLLLLT